MLSSETCAFDLIHAEFVREIEPGEVVIIDENGIALRVAVPAARRSAFCIFEYVYFARPDSHIDDINVQRRARRDGPRTGAPASGRGRRRRARAGLAATTPRSASPRSWASRIDHAFVRNHYIGRTFLQPTQLIRDFNVRVKLNLISEAVRGKRVVVVDDSIVRGTTARARVVNLREAGAKEVHMRISCPPHKHACHYGIDFPDPEKLLANQMTAERNPRISRRGQPRLPRPRCAGARHRAAAKPVLPRLLQRRISRAVRSEARQVHHGAPPASRGTLAQEPDTQPSLFALA